MMQKLQRLGKALMGAVAVLPVAALLMGIGYWIDPTGWGSNNVIALFLIKGGGAILDNLGLVFAVAIAFGLSRDSNGAAALSGLIGFLTVTTLLSPAAVAAIRGVEVKALPASEGWAQMGPKNVFIGILIGIVASMVYGKFHRTRLPDFLAFFSGRRCVPIVTSIASIFIAIILYFVWPFFFNALTNFGEWMQGLGALGAGIYGFFNRLLIPTGLHHALNAVFWWDIAGINDIPNFLGGAETIAKMGESAIGEVGRYQAGFFPIMMFGLPGAALAMYHTAKPENRKVALSLLSAGALASFFTGVTEPLEFSFMFLAPVLYFVHALLTGISMFIAATFHWTAGFGFSAGFVDMVLSARNPIAHKWWALLIMGVVFFFVYYIIFRVLIVALNLKTPGREDQPANEGTTFASDHDFHAMAVQIIKGLGGLENIDRLDHCVTRLRVEIKDYTAVNEAEIKKAGIAGIVRPSQKNVQVIVGPQVQFVYDEACAIRDGVEVQ